jgi:PKD repeat protein
VVEVATFRRWPRPTDRTPAQWGTRSVSGAGSSDPDGTIATYSWAFGDGGTGTGASPSHVYTTAGPKTVTLTVTDNLGSTATDQATVTVTDPGSSTPFTWSGSFGAINPADSLVVFTIIYNLSTDIVETPGAEALQNWTVDSLKWNPAVLRYHSFNFGPGGFGAVNPTFAIGQGRLDFSGTQPASNASGQVVIATIRFKVIGGAGSSTTTSTALGNLISTAATGAYNYRSKTIIQEATLVAP